MSKNLEISLCAGCIGA